MNAQVVLNFLANEAIKAEYAGNRRRADSAIKAMKFVIKVERIWTSVKTSSVKRSNEPPWAKPTHRVVRFKANPDPLADGARPIPVYERDPPPLPPPDIPRKNPWWDFEHGFEHNLGHYGGNIGEMSLGGTSAVAGGGVGGVSGAAMGGAIDKGHPAAILGGAIVGLGFGSSIGGFYGARNGRGIGLNLAGSSFKLSDVLPKVGDVSPETSRRR
jgi:hypothetical protein